MWAREESNFKQQFFSFFSIGSLSTSTPKTLFSLGQQDGKPYSLKEGGKNKSKTVRERA